MANKQQSAAQRREKQRQQREQRLQGTQNRVQSTPVANRRRPTARRRSWNQSYMIAIVIGLIVVIVGAFVLISKLQSNAAAPTPTSSQVLNAVTKVDPNILSVVGMGKLQSPLKPPSGSPPVLTGPTSKPEFLYIGAEWCPFCAAQKGHHSAPIYKNSGLLVGPVKTGGDPDGGFRGLCNFPIPTTDRILGSTFVTAFNTCELVGVGAAALDCNFEINTKAPIMTTIRPIAIAIMYD